MKFKINQTSFIDDKLVSAGTEMDMVPRGKTKKGDPIHHVPGPHWLPVDDEAKALCEKLGHTYTGEMPDAVEDIARSMEAKALESGVKVDHAALAAAISEGIAKALAPILQAIAAKQGAGASLTGGGGSSNG